MVGPVALALLAVLATSVWYFGTKRLVLGLLSAYKRFNVLRLRLAGRTPTQEADRRVLTGEAWAEFCDTLKGAGAAVLAGGAPEDALSQAEGYRYLSRLARVGLEAFVECADPCAPKVRGSHTPTTPKGLQPAELPLPGAQLVALANGSRDARVCIGADSPDNLYQNATIDAAHTYRLLGKRGTVHYLGLSTNAVNPPTAPVFPAITRPLPVYRCRGATAGRAG